MKKNKAYSEFMIYTVVSIIIAVISFLTMIVLTRITSEAFFGRINKFIAASNVAMSLICVGLDTAYIRFYYEPPENTNSRQLAWKCIYPSIYLLGLLTIVVLGLRNNNWLVFLIGSGGLLFTVAFVLTVFSQFLIRYMTIYFRMSSKVFCFSVVSLAFVILTKTFFIPMHYVSDKYEDNIIFASIILFAFTSILFAFYSSKIIEIKKVEHNKYKSVYRFALMSSPVFVITYLNTYIPQIIISNKLGDDTLGIYSAALLFCSAIQVLSTGFTTFWSPYMYKYYKTETTVIKNIHDLVLFFCVLFFSLILFFSNVLYLFIGESFRKNQNILGFLLIYPIILIIVETTHYGIEIKKKNEISLFIYFITTLINVVLCGVLVKKHGLLGIAISSMFSSIIQFFLMSCLGQKYYSSVNNILKTIFNIIVLVFSAFCFYWFYNNRIYFILIESFLVIVCLFIDKNIIIWGINYFKNEVIERKKNVKQ